MPKELPELVGEPLGFGEQRIVKADGMDARIQKAILLNDICHKFKGKLPGRKLLLCFSETEKYGTGLSFMEILDFEDAYKFRVLLSMHILAKEVKEKTEMGTDFLEVLRRTYGIKEKEFLALL